MSWILMYGDRDTPDAEFACQSTGPRECVVPASRSEQQAFADVHTYFHGVGEQTTYEGTVGIGFFDEGGRPHESATKITVRGDEKIINQSVTGIVTSKPGRYFVQLVFNATLSGGGHQSIREDVPVTVK